jgi:hypothetical protein
MNRLGTISGTGRVSVGGVDVGEAQYAIAVFQSGQMKDAHGTIRAGEDLIWEVYQASDQALLQLENGGVVKFLVTNSSAGSGLADIAISGPVPGF